MLRSDSDTDHEAFRSSLVESILNHPSLGHLSAGEKTSLIAFLTEERPPLPRLIPSDTHTRLRALKKAASDTKRLANSLKLLDAQDIILCDLENPKSQKINDRINGLNETVDEIETRVKNLKEDIIISAKSTQMLRSLYAYPLLTTLENYGVATKIRNDFVSISALEDSNEKNTYLPDVDGNATAAMRCIMLTLHSSKTENIDWSLTVSLIKLGKPLRDQSIVSNKYLAELKALMAPYINELHHNMSLTVDLFENHVEHELSAAQENCFDRIHYLPNFIPASDKRITLH